MNLLLLHRTNGGLENMINWECKDKDMLALIKYIANEDKTGKGT